MIVSFGNFHAKWEGRNLNLFNGILRDILENSESLYWMALEKMVPYIGLQVIGVEIWKLDSAPYKKS